MSLDGSSPPPDSGSFPTNKTLRVEPRHPRSVQNTPRSGSGEMVWTVSATLFLDPLPRRAGERPSSAQAPPTPAATQEQRRSDPWCVAPYFVEQETLLFHGALRHTLQEHDLDHLDAFFDDLKHGDVDNLGDNLQLWNRNKRRGSCRNTSVASETDLYTCPFSLLGGLDAWSGMIVSSFTVALNKWSTRMVDLRFEVTCLILWSELPIFTIDFGAAT